MYLGKEKVDRILKDLSELDLGGLKGFYFEEDDNGDLKLLGAGSSAYIYAAHKRSLLPGEKKYAIKIMGFLDKNMNPDEFENNCSILEDISMFSDNLVEIEKHFTMEVALDENDELVAARQLDEESDENAPEEEAENYDNIVRLQFIIMERLIPVISKGPNREPILFSERLKSGDVKEVLKLGSDIAEALNTLHDHNIIHRDIKLENIFYCEKYGTYKLGDFEISKVTYDGMAFTTAYTKGYGAPEIVSRDTEYSLTADIYSLGVTMYILLNGLKFPGSDSYSVNAAVQYKKGFVLPYIRTEPDGLYNILAKMCMYEEKDRYQTAFEVLFLLRRILNGDIVTFAKKRQKVFLWISVVLVFAIPLAHRFTGILGFTNGLFYRVENLLTGSGSYSSIFLIAIAGLSIFKYVASNIYRKNWNLFIKIFTAVLFIDLGLGIFMLINSFSWINLILIVILACSRGEPGLLLGTFLLSYSVTSAISDDNGLVTIFIGNKWIEPALFFAAIFMICFRLIVRFSNSERTMADFWKMFALFFLAIWVFAPEAGYGVPALVIWTNSAARGVLSMIDFSKAGMVDFIFCIVFEVYITIIPRVNPYYFLKRQKEN